MSNEIVPAAAGQIPQSDALKEASLDSLSELFSRDPEGYSKQDLAQVVLAMRAQRDRLAQAAEEKPAKAPRGSGPKAVATLQSKVGAGDLGL